MSLIQNTNYVITVFYSCPLGTHVTPILQVSCPCYVLCVQSSFSCYTVDRYIAVFRPRVHKAYQNQAQVINSFTVAFFLNLL